MSAAPELDLTGKVIHVYIKVGAVDTHSVSQFGVSNPKYEEVAGRLFLIGDTIDFGDVSIWKGMSIWHSGAKVGILWELVGCYLVFDSVSVYKRALSTNAEQRANLAESQTASNPKSLWPFRRA